VDQMTGSPIRWCTGAHAPQRHALVNVHSGPIRMQCVRRQCATMDVREQFGKLAEPIIRVTLQPARGNEFKATAFGQH
jgi:hypothetical protein